jgi:hypothetical protein
LIFPIDSEMIRSRSSRVVSLIRIDSITQSLLHVTFLQIPLARIFSKSWIPVPISRFIKVLPFPVPSA